MNKRFLSGYMAITLAIMLSVVMIMLGLSLSAISLLGHTNGLSESLKQKSTYAAHGCLEQALLSLSLSSAYGGNETVTIQFDGESLPCTIAPVTAEGANKVIKAQATVRNSTTNLTLKVNGTTLSRVSLEETI